MKKLSLLLMAAVCSLNLMAQEAQFHDNKVISHRGAWKNTGHPQNSLASFRAAAEMGCHGSECDVHLTLDDSLVVYHDLSHAGMLIEKT
ncbi:MAG: glycerophosphodiester phosphodiesterase, partial [Alistipes sp.]|nr:glycerophosphodiester phosphodiesterase [Alistipes sp.]